MAITLTPEVSLKPFNYRTLEKIKIMALRFNQGSYDDKISLSNNGTEEIT